MTIEAAKVNIYISDQAEEFRIEISGRFAGTAVNDAATAWKSALNVNTPRRICVDITRMTGYDRSGFTLLREFYLHGTHIAAGTPRSLLFFTQISDSRSTSDTPWSERDDKRQPSRERPLVQRRAMASGE